MHHNKGNKGNDMEQINRQRTVFAMAIVLFVVTIIVLATALMGKASATGGDNGEPCVPSPAVPAVPGTPEVPAVTEEQRTGWQRYSWTGGPHESDDPPAFPSDDWQPNVKGDPHGVGKEGAYWRSNGNSGKGDWFYLEGIYETVVITPAVPATPGTPAIPEVVCETPTETPTTPTETPTVTETPITPTETPSVPTETPTTDTPSETPTVAPETPEQETVDEPEAEVEDDPVVQTTTVNEPHRQIKVRTHASGKVTREVIEFGEDAVEEGL